MNRIEHVDIAKGIGIILIVASHVVLETDKASALEAVAYSYWCNFLSSFYVPVFFLLSGIFEKESIEWSNFRKRLLRCIRYILIFSIWGTLAYYTINGHWNIKKGVLTYTPIWFLIVLFYITVCFGLIKRLKSTYQYFITLIGGMIGCALANSGHGFLMIGQTLLCMPFYAIGYWYKNLLKSKTFRLQIFFACLVVWIFITLSFDAPNNISLNHIGRDPLCFYADALCGSVLLVEISKLIKSKILSYIGQNSIIIMMTHFMFVHINYNILHIHIDSWPVWFLFVLAWMIFSCCFIPLLRNKYYKII